MVLSYAEAACSSAIRVARNIVRDVGESAAARSGGLVQLARCNEGHGERDTHILLSKKLRLSLPIPITFVQTADPDLKIPTLRIRDWFQHFVQNSLWHFLCGLANRNEAREEAILETFWAKYRLQYPGHDIFRLADDGDIQLKRCLPFVLHGDEGRGRKRAAFMVISWHSLLGRGTAPGKDERKATGTRPFAKLEPNFLGHSYTTRYLLAALNKKSYTDENDHSWGALMDNIAKECAFMVETGVCDKMKRQYFGVMVHVCGDWPFLQKSGNLTRTFNNIEKRANAANPQPKKGICHLCEAGKDGVPFEQLSTSRPIWMRTMFKDPPFRDTPPFVDLPHVQGQAPSIFAYDIWHCWHLGVGRNFVGSMLAVYSNLEQGGNVDERFDALTIRYKSWCSSNHESHILNRLTKEVIQWPNTKHFPTATWHRGDLTRIMMRWIEDRFATEAAPADPYWQKAGEAAVSINKAISLLYKSPLYLEPPAAKVISDLGLRFLRRYTSLAEEAGSQGDSFFVIMPKCHPLHHMFLSLHWAVQRNVPHLSPLGLSVQMDEDFIGRPSRLSRRVTGRKPVMLRVIQRYLKATHRKWEECGLIRTKR